MLCTGRCVRFWRIDVLNPIFDDYLYAIAPGWDADPEDMQLIHVLLGQPPVTQPPDEYPIRTTTLDGQEWGDGRIDHALEFLDFIPISKIGIIETTFHAGGTLVSAPVTLAVRHHQRAEIEGAEWVRYNCWSILPKSGGDWSALDYLVDGEQAAALRWRFQRLRRIVEEA